MSNFLLKSDEVLVRYLNEDDFYTVVKYANNKKIANFLKDNFPNPYKYEHIEEFYIATTLASEITNFAIANEKEFAGMIGFNYLKDIKRFTAEIGYWVAEPYWGKGYASTALSLVSNYIFSKKNVSRIQAEVRADNIASIKVLEKVGFTLEGVLKESFFKNGKMYDSLLYAKMKN
ncbi:MAG: GNAT family N-acetyltransferase [Ignavibacteriaceae bacterium]|nr:GNAT family N-acetyltransferase [Ignavibacteriaceae bacterium]